MPTIKRQITVVTFTYWFLLVYVLAALIWWFISLEEQNKIITELKLQQLSTNNTIIHSSQNFIKAKQNIEKARLHKTYQYIGEGSTFLLIIFIGATFVYNIVRKRLMLSYQQKNFMMAITHELKTPIAIAKLNLETLLKRQLEHHQQQRLISNALQEANRLNDLCSNILISAQLEGGAYKLHKTVINLSTLTEEIAQNFTNRFPQRIIRYNIIPGITIFGEILLLELMINNIIENAFKYSPIQEPIIIELQKNQKKAILNISDYGKGIPDDEKPKIWNRFYRIGNEDTRSNKGTGIGLYLCKKIAKDHKANITVMDNTPTGSIFTIQFSILEKKTYAKTT